MNSMNLLVTKSRDPSTSQSTALGVPNKERKHNCTTIEGPETARYMCIYIYIFSCFSIVFFQVCWISHTHTHTFSWSLQESGGDDVDAVASQAERVEGTPKTSEPEPKP